MFAKYHQLLRLLFYEDHSTLNYLLQLYIHHQPQHYMERHPSVQLEIIEGEIQYNSEPIQTDEMRFNEVDYMNEFHKENNQSLIWVRDTEYKCEKRKILLTNEQKHII